MTSLESPVLIFELGAVGAAGIAIRQGPSETDPPPVVAEENKGCFGLEVTQLLRVVEPTVISPVPLAPAVVLGIMSFHGRIVTVVDPAPILGLNVPTVSGPETRVVVLRQGELSMGNVGLYVTRVEKIAPAGDLEAEDVPARSCIKWVAREGKRLINIVDVEPLLEKLAHEFGTAQGREPRQGVG